LASLSEKVLLVTVRVPSLKMPPPLSSASAGEGAVGHGVRLRYGAAAVRIAGAAGIPILHSDRIQRQVAALSTTRTASFPLTKLRCR
jgi:hypothetical protein